MLNRTFKVLLLAGALVLGLLGAALATGPAPEITGGTSQELPLLGSDSTSGTGQSQADPDRQEDLEELPEAIRPDPVGTISFSNLDSRMRENNVNLLALEESIASIESNDYDKMTEDTRNQINSIANMQWESLQIPMMGSMMAASLDAQYKALRDVFDDLNAGVLQADYAAIVRQMRNAQDQIIMTGESLYIALVSMEQNNVTLDRSLAALDRTIQELELRYELGQISSLTLQQTKGNRTSLVSGQQTLQSNLAIYKTRLELLIGAEQSGDIRLQALPQVSAKQLDGMDLERDLAAAQKASYELFSAQRTLDDAQQDFKDAGKEYHHNEKKYQYVAAQHTWQSAQHTYNATVQNFELKFRTLYAQVKDCQQVLQASRTALAVEQANYAADQLKYEQGTISKNALLTAKDDLAAAQDKVDSAAVELFSAYNNYCWAVEHGILN